MILSQVGVAIFKVMVVRATPNVLYKSTLTHTQTDKRQADGRLDIQ